ncbi:MAG: transglutaminase domain-containing protein [Lachnospiraceae bacterium]|nr:transglutaminase domain-containing protein [Lachnospiraceae bacterium]
MKTIFIEEIVDHSFSLKCIPKTFQGQEIQDLEVKITPDVKVSGDVDSFGNHLLYGRLREPHDLFVVRVTGKAVVQGNPLAEPDPVACMLFKYPTKYTMPGDSLKLLYENEKEVLQDFDNRETDSQGSASLKKAWYITELVHERMHYSPGVTGLSTTAEEAYTIRKGVCQDYAHIMLALLRMEHIPARYVVGMMEGEGASHAWVEVYDEGFWHGFDPTNHKRTDDSYVKISHGRDYQDCLVERGIFRGNGRQQKIVGVKVSEQ